MVKGLSAYVFILLRAGRADISIILSTYKKLHKLNLLCNIIYIIIGERARHSQVCSIGNRDIYIVRMSF